MNIKEYISDLYRAYKYASYYNRKLIEVMALLPIIILLSHLIRLLN